MSLILNNNRTHAHFVIDRRGNKTGPSHYFRKQFSAQSYITSSYLIAAFGRLRRSAFSSTNCVFRNICFINILKYVHKQFGRDVMNKCNHSWLIFFSHQNFRACRSLIGNDFINKQIKPVSSHLCCRSLSQRLAAVSCNIFRIIV
jgi:hypothetical protein